MHLQKFEDQAQRDARRRRKNRIPLSPEEKTARAKANWKKFRGHVADMRYTPNYMVQCRLQYYEEQVQNVNGIELENNELKEDDEGDGRKNLDPDEKKWYHSLIVNPETSSWLGFWSGIINVCYFYGFFRDPYYIAFHIARNDTFNENFIPPAEIDMTNEMIVDVVLAINILIQALTTFRKSDGTWEMSIFNLILHYLNESMIRDCLGVFPTLFSGQSKEFYLFKILRLIKITQVYDVISDINLKILMNFMFKSSAVKLNNILNMIIMMFQSIHVLGCLWIGVAKMVVCSWIEQGQRPENEKCDVGSPVDQNDEFSTYVTAVYWIITTLTTVGYGDYKGYTVVEYYFQMVVEFLGIGVFSWLMGSINGMVASDCDLQLLIDDRNEQIEEWLRKLQNSRDKILDRNLAKAIQHYTEKSYQYDFLNITKEEFFNQLKPRIKHKLINTLFAQFITNFFYLFNDSDFEAGCEFTTEFVTNLVPKMFLPENTIIDYGEEFDQMYLIQESCVSLQLKVDKLDKYDKLTYYINEKGKRVCKQFYTGNQTTDKFAEFMIMPTFSYFGDYQIFENIRSQIRFKASDGGQCKTLVLLSISKESFLKLMYQFPEANDYYKPKAKARRIEFKRIMRNYYIKLQSNKFTDLFGAKQTEMLQKFDNRKKTPTVNLAGMEEKEVEVVYDREEFLFCEENPGLKIYEEKVNLQSRIDTLIGTKISKFYDVSFQKCMDEYIDQDFDTDELEPLSEDEVPFDYSNCLPETNQEANAKTTENIHQTIDKVSSIYNYMTEGLYQNNLKVTEFMDKLEQESAPLDQCQPPELLSMKQFIEDVSNNDIPRIVNDAKRAMLQHALSDDSNNESEELSQTI